MDYFLSFVPIVIEDVSWDVGFDFLGSMISACSDSAPGPDGAPYSCWKNSPKEVRKIFHECYCEVPNGDLDLPEGFNTSKTVFLLKRVI